MLRAGADKPRREAGRVGLPAPFFEDAARESGTFLKGYGSQCNGFGREGEADRMGGGGDRRHGGFFRLGSCGFGIR